MFYTFISPQYFCWISEHHSPESSLSFRCRIDWGRPGNHSCSRESCTARSSITSSPSQSQHAPWTSSTRPSDSTSTSSRWERAAGVSRRYVFPTVFSCAGDYATPVRRQRKTWTPSWGWTWRGPCWSAWHAETRSFTPPSPRNERRSTTNTRYSRRAVLESTEWSYSRWERSEKELWF